MLHSKELFIEDNMKGYNHLFFNSNESYINDANKIESAFEMKDTMSDNITEHNAEIFNEQMDGIAPLVQWKEGNATDVLIVVRIHNGVQNVKFVLKGGNNLNISKIISIFALFNKGKHNIMDNIMEKHPIADSLIEYLKNLSPEEEEKLWKEVEPYSHIGPIVEDYFEYLDKIQK